MKPLPTSLQWDAMLTHLSLMRTNPDNSHSESVTEVPCIRLNRFPSIDAGQQQKRLAWHRRGRPQKFLAYSSIQTRHQGPMDFTKAPGMIHVKRRESRPYCTLKQVYWRIRTEALLQHWVEFFSKVLCTLRFRVPVMRLTINKGSIQMGFLRGLRASWSLIYKGISRNEVRQS